MREFLRHAFFPQPSNNYRAKILHHSVLFSLLILVLSISITLPTWVRSFPQVLGTSVDITNQQLLALTNQKRQAVGLQPLKLNDELSQAAAKKAADMFSKNYWAHNAPDGTTPWVFIKSSGYTYTYAGENLARGFTTSSDVVQAWMASPSHRENMLSSNYQDIGFAISTGKLNGEDTVLVVEMFGNTGLPIAQRPFLQGQAQAASETLTGAQSVLPSSSQPLLTNTTFLRNAVLFILFIFIFTLVIDMIIVQRRQIVRLLTHNLDHVLYLFLIAILIIIMKGGFVL